MKKLLLLLTFLYTLTSCSTYYYSTLSAGDGMMEKDDFGDFFYEDDSIKVVYNFFGYNLPVKILVINNSDEPIYVDWQRSALIMDNFATSYNQNKAIFDGQIETNTLNYNRNLAGTDGRVTGGIQLPEGVSFVPPKSRIDHIPTTMSDFRFHNIPGKSFVIKSFATSEQKPARVKTMHFAEFNSPLRFRSYLTIYRGYPNPEKSKPFVLDQTFFVSDLMKSGTVKPSDVLSYTSERGDFFYYKKVKGSAFGNTVGVIALCGVSLFLEAVIDSPEGN